VVKVYQLLARGRWFSPGTPASSTTKTGRHDIVEILLKVALSAINHHSNQQYMQSRDTGNIGRVHPFCNLQIRARTHILQEISSSNIYITVSRVKRLINRTQSVRFFNSENRDINDL
jgi:hypothetical protein